jgi:hypothetical protein
MTPASPFTPEEMEIYRRLNEKQLRFAASQRQEETKIPTEVKTSVSDIYWKNLMTVQGFNPRF